MSNTVILLPDLPPAEQEKLGGYRECVVDYSGRVIGLMGNTRPVLKNNLSGYYLSSANSYIGGRIGALRSLDSRGNPTSLLLLCLCEDKKDRWIPPIQFRTIKTVKQAGGIQRYQEGSQNKSDEIRPDYTHFQNLVHCISLEKLNAVARGYLAGYSEICIQGVESNIVGLLGVPGKPLFIGQRGNIKALDSALLPQSYPLRIRAIRLPESGNQWEGKYLGMVPASQWGNPGAECDWIRIKDFIPEEKPK